MEQPKPNNSRKKFLLWVATIISSLAVFKFFPQRKRKQVESKETVKMFSREGKLVEIDKRYLVSSGNKISNEELQKWVKR